MLFGLQHQIVSSVVFATFTIADLTICRKVRFALLTSIYTLLQNQMRRLLLVVTSRRWLAMAMGNLPPFEDRDAYGGFFPALLQT
ncbi:MAG: hypothetical protein EORIYHIE_000168 [Candidatus Fervidibacter sp.]